MVVASPSGGQQLLPFSAVTHQRLHQSAARPGADPAAGDQVPGAPFGQPLPGGRLAWAVNGAALEVLCCRTGARRAAWTFGAHRPDAPPPQITAVCAISEAAGPAAAHLLAVGLDCGGRSETAGSPAGTGGMVCVFDLSAAAVVRAVQLPHQVTALAVLRAPPSPDVCRPLQEMSVLAAVGTHAGFVLLLDLCLDGPVSTTERAPGVPTYVTVLEPAVAQRREEQAALGNHLCLPLNDDAVEAGLYRHCTSRGRPEHAQPADDTWVSAVHYVPQLRSLVVGLSFGCFQVWNLETLQMEFASRYEPRQLPVVGCVFLEPENDPRRFVYLWLLNSVPAHHDMNDSVASAALYALLYTEREWEQGAPVYRGLEQAGMKLVYDLTTTPEQPDAGRVSASCLLSALSLPASVPDASGGGEDSLVPRDATSCALVWEAWTEDGASACTCLALFDLNRWYQAHMPHRVDAAALERCEYLRFFSLDAREGIVMGVSVRAVDSRSGLLATTLLLDVGVQALTFCGPQEQLLRTLQAAGGVQLADPLQAYETARRLGLVPSGAISPAEQREALLTLALERGFSSLLAACASRWSSGDADPAGCTLRALLDWLWRRAVEVVTQIDATCVPLFDMSGGVLADEDVSALHGLRAQLDGMGHVLDTMATRTANTDGGLGELQSKSYVLRVRSLHTAVIMWLCHAGLLPEQGETPGEETLEFAYPGAALAQWYVERRRQLGRRLLMIDGLAEELGEPLRAYWQEDGDGSYPPRSLLALTRAYLLDGVPDVRKHRLTHYLLMDLSRLVSDEHDDTLKSFPSCFAMSPSLIKLTHAFWHLDHGNVDSALVFLMDPLVQPADLSAWQHRRIVESLLAQDAPRAALQYARARHLPAPHAADLKLHLRVLLDNGLVTEALKYERRHRTLGGDELAGWLLSGCQQRRLLTQLMRQPMDTALERRFVEFLQENADKECAELLHVFYLQRGRYREAAELQRRLAAVAPLVPERADFRESLHQLLPALTHRRDGSPRAGPCRLGASGARSRPLSAQLHQVPATVRSRATLIQELLEQDGKKPAPTPVAATPFRPRHKRKLPEDEESCTPRAGQRRPLGSDVRRLLQTPPVRRVARRSDVQVGTPQARTPAAIMTPQSILKVHRYLEASGGASGEDTPSKQLRFGLLRGRRSLEESRGDTTLPPLATLFTPGKTPAPLRRPARDAPSAAPADRSPSPATAATPVRLASLFTPGKTPRPLAARVGRLPEPRVTLADAWAAAERTPTPEPVSPPRKRQSLASELDDSEFYSFEASPTVANQTVEIFDRERQLRLVERSWHDESDVAATRGGDVMQRSRAGDDDVSPTVANQTVEIFDRERQLRLVERSWRDESDVAVTMGGDVTQRSRAGDDDDTVSEERTSPPPSEEEGQRHSTPQQELAALRSPGLGGRVSLSTPRMASKTTSLRQEVLVMSASADSPRKQLHLVSPSPRRELHRASVSSRTEEPDEAPASPCRKSQDAANSDGEKFHVSDGARREVHTEILTELLSVSVATSSASAAELAKPSEDDERRVSGSSGEFSPLIGNKFSSLMAEGVSMERSLDALEAQVLAETSVVHTERTETRREESPEETNERQPGEEPVVAKRTAWVTGEESEEQDRSLSALEAQVLTVTSVTHTKRSETRHEESVLEESPGEEPVAVKQTAWVTGGDDEEDREQEGDASEGGLSSLEAQVLAGTSVTHTKKAETRREESVVEESPGKEPVVVKRVAWVTGKDDDQEGDEPAVEEDTSPLSSSYLAPPTGMQEALQRIGRALDIPEWSVTDAPRSSLTSSGTGLLSSGSEVADSRIELRLQLDSESEEEEKEELELFEGFTSLQARSDEPVSPSPPSSPAGGRLSRSSVLRQASPAAGTPLLTPRSSLRRRAGAAAVTETTESVSIAVMEEATATSVTEEVTATSVTEEVAVTSVTEKVTATSATEEVTATSATEEVTATSVTEEVTATSVTEEVTATSMAQEVAATSVTEEVTATSVTEEVTATSMAQEVTATSVTEEVTATSGTEEVTATSVTTSVVKRTVVAGVGGSEEVEASIGMAEAAEIVKRTAVADVGESEEMEVSIGMAEAPETESSSPQRPDAEQDLAAVKTRSRTPSPKKDERTTTSSPKRSLRVTTPSPKRSPSVTTPSPKRSPHDKSVSVAELAPAAMASPKGSPARTPSTKKTQSATLSSPEKTPSSVQPDSPALEEAHSSEHASPVAGIASPSTSPEEESTEPPSSPEAKIATPSAPVAKITTPTSSPPTRASVRAEAARADPAPLSPLAEEQPSEVPSSPPADTAATLPATPSSVRRSGRRSLAATTTPRSRLSLLAAVDPLSPVPEGQSVGAAAGDSVETNAAAEELEPTEVEDPASTRKRTRRSVSTEPEPVAPTSTSKRPGSRAGSVGPATPGTPVRRSMRTRSVSLEPEEPKDLVTATDDGDTRRRSLRGVSVERDVFATAGTPSRSLKSRQASEEPEKAPDAVAKGRRTRKASEEPEEPSALETTARRRRTRKTSETKSTDDSVSLDTTQKGRQSWKTSEEPEDQSKLDTTVKTRRARKASEEPEEPSVVDTTRKTRRTRKASEEPEEPSVLDTTHKTRRTRKASEEPEEPSVLDTTHKTRRTRKASEKLEEQSVDTARKPRRARKVSEEPEEPSILEMTRTTRTRKTSEPPEVEAHVQPSTSKRTRKQSQASESSEGAVSPEPAAKSRRYLRHAADDTSASPARNTRARSLSVQPESPERLPTRAASEQPPEVRPPTADAATSARKRRPVPAAAAEPSTPAAVPPTKRGRPPSSKKGKTPAAAAAAAATDEEAPEEETAPDAADERSQSPPLKRRVARRSSQAGARRRSQMPAITESAAEAMPPPASTTTAGRRRRRRTTRPAPEEEEEEAAGSPVVLLTEEQLERMRQREDASPEQVSRDRRTSIARTRQRTGGRRSVKLW